MVPTMLFLLLRYVVSILPLADNYVEWIFSFCSQLVLNFTVVVALYFILNRDKELGDFTDAFYIKKPKNLSPATLSIIIVMPFVLRYASVGLSYLTQVFLLNLGFTTVSGAGTIYSSPWVFVAEVVTTAVLPAFCEEFYNRGVLLSATSDMKDGWGKALFLGLMFGLFHQNVQQFFYTFFAGFVFGIVAMKTKSIWPCVYMHFVNNFLSVLYDYSSQRGNFIGQLYDMFYETILPTFFLIIFLSWIIAAAAVVYMCYLIMKESKQTVQEEPERRPFVENDFFSLADSVRSYNGDGIFNFAPRRTETVPTEAPTVVGKKSFADYGFLIATITVTVLSTVATYIWGVLR